MLKLAGVNVAIVIQVGRDIQGKAVKANPSFNCNSEGCNFTVFDPDTTVLRLPPRAEVKVGQSQDYGFFEQVDKLADPNFPCGQIDHRIAYQLPGAMVGDISSSFNLVYSYPLRSKLFRRGQNVARTSTSTQGDYWLVLYQEQSIGDSLPLAELDQFPLQVEYLEVLGLTEINQPSGIIYHWSFVLRHKAQG
jgi:hypothetical protein